MAQVADTGTQITLTIKDSAGVAVDLTGATSPQITIRQPSGALVTPTTSVVSPATDGKLRCLTLVGTFSAPGEYSAQGYWANEAGSWRTKQRKFWVEANL